MTHAEKIKIAKEVYLQIYKSITEIEEKYFIYCTLPSYIEVDGERFYKSQLYDEEYYKNEDKLD